MDNETLIENGGGGRKLFIIAINMIYNYWKMVFSFIIQNLIGKNIKVIFLNVD